MGKTRRAAWVGFAATSALVALITLTPQSATSAHAGISAAMLRALHAIGVPPSFGPAEWEFTANVIMFMPLGFFLTLALPRGVRRWGVLVLPLMSGLIETAQLLFLPSRFATLSDLVANSTGGWIGILLALLAVRVFGAARSSTV